MDAFRRLGVAVLVAALAAGAAPTAAAPKEVPLAIEGQRFNPAEITVAAGAPFVLVITNRDTAAEEFESRELHVEKVIPAGKTVRVRIGALKRGTYPFFGDFHPKTAQGRIIAE